ncbi:MAG: DNA alkylation repair protein [Parachlamydia sp.]|jgi:3-methyladenine DNA glycosylase AlkD|nr:DNA alkylation repair protein [Parachlamydia sp.]
MRLVHELEQAFISGADEVQAERKSAYMRNLFPFYGLPTPLRKALQKPLFKSHPIGNETQLRQLLEDLWMKEQREFQYAALDAAESFRKKASPQILEHYAEMIRKKSWWDTVDAIAPNLVGPLVAQQPMLVDVMDQWVQDDDLWIRRAALLFQLRWKKQTDSKRLFAYCAKLMHERDFFIRKAIGWALREFSKTDPKAVREFIESHRLQLSPLSIKEGSKYV